MLNGLMDELMMESLYSILRYTNKYIVSNMSYSEPPLYEKIRKSEISTVLLFENAYFAWLA